MRQQAMIAGEITRHGQVSVRAQGKSSPSLVFLWTFEFDYAARNHHGGYIRYFNIARELIDAGHRVIFLPAFQESERSEGRIWFEDLVRRGAITGFFELRRPPAKSLFARAIRAALPGLAERTSEDQRQETIGAIMKLAGEVQADVIIGSSRRLFFAVAAQNQLVRVVDLTDSEVLYFWRDFRNRWSVRRFQEAAQSLYRVCESAISERFYTRRSEWNVVVSPVDKKVLDRLNGAPSTNLVLPNGINNGFRGAPSPKKVEKRLIFSGNMSFGPNFQAALFLIDSVLPLVHREEPDVQLVIAGANPVAELLARQSDRVRVTGYVEDMDREIATSAIYVAPLVSGSGFKNKILEAIVNRTFVVATPMAVEFLDARVRDRISIAESPEAMARSIVHFLRKPELTHDSVDQLHRLVSKKYSWTRSAELLTAAVKASRHVPA